MKRSTKVFVAAGIALFIACAFIGYAIATDNDTHEVTHLTEHHSVGPAEPVAAIFYSKVARHDGHSVGKLVIHKRLGDPKRTAMTRSGAIYHRNFKVWIDGPNPYTGQMQIEGIVSGTLTYNEWNNDIIDYTENTDCAVGALVWHCDNNPLSVVKGGGLNPTGIRYTYRRVRWQFTGDYTVGGVGVHKTITPWVSITARANGTFAFDKGGL